MVQAYCMKCRSKKEMKDPKSITMKNGKPAENIFAAGEIMAGNILPKGYIGGIGLVIGNIFGRVAGKEATAFAKNVGRQQPASDS